MICGLLGKKLSHSYSPQIHGELADYSYALFEKNEEDLDHFITSNDFHALNVTIPYKKAVIPFCKKLSPQAEKLGAVNTIVRQQDGSLIGHNTDYFGFQSMLRRTGIQVQNKKVLVLGSGGASNTVCAVLKESGANVVMVSRNGENNYSNLHLHTDCKVIVNATPVGMHPNNGETPVDISVFPMLEGVLDLIYNPAKTKLLLDAEARGLIAENGLWMLVAQAKESAEWFTSSKIPDDEILRIYKKLKNSMENTILIGMPGCGKSTIGKILAERLGKVFVDADACIEEAAGCSIPDIFKTGGEQEFRAIETKVLSELTKRSGLVIATGGGCVTKEENYPLLKQNGIVIWIKRNIEDLPTEGRPLSQNNRLCEMYAIRKPLYQNFSDIEVNNQGTPEETAYSIIKELNAEDRL